MSLIIVGDNHGGWNFWKIIIEGSFLVQCTFLEGDGKVRLGLVSVGMLLSLVLSEWDYAKSENVNFRANT